MTTKERTCEERIDGMMVGRLGDIASLVAVAGTAANLFELDDEEKRLITGEDKPDEDEWGPYALQEAAQERMWELPLSIEVTRTVEVLLSTGGPEDALHADIDRDGTIVRIEYIFKDWFDGARRTLHGSDFDTAEAFIRAVWADEG